MTADYTVTVTVLSIRFKRPGVHGRLRDHAESGGESISSVAERLIDEGIRMHTHPGIVFRDGPAGRRAGLAAGPDVAQIAPLLTGLGGSVDQRVTAAAEQLGLTHRQVRAASRYYAQFRDEIDAEVDANEAAADRELALWEAEQRLLSG